MKCVYKYAAFIAAILAIATISSCNKNKNEQTKHIPNNANLVVAINPASFYSKLKGQRGELDTLISSLAQKLMHSDSAKEKSELAQQAFDLKKSFFFFAKTTNSISEGKSFSSAFIAPLKDRDKFIELLKSDNQNISITQGTDFSFISKRRAVIGWNKDIAIIIPSYTNYSDSTGQKAALATLFNMKESESIAANKSFTKSFAPNADISFYSNSAQSLASVSMLALTKASDLVKDMYSAGTVNFDNGEVGLKVTTYPNSTLLDLLKKNLPEKLSKHTLENFPGTPQGIADISINIKQLVSILNYMGVEQMINPFLQHQGLSLDDVAAAFKGEIAVASSNFSMKQKPLLMSNNIVSSPDASYVICIPIADKKAYDKILTALANTDNSAFTNVSGQLVPSALLSKGQGFLVNDKYLLIGSSQALIDSFAGGKGKISWPDDVDKNLKGKTSYFYGDLQSVLNALPATGSDSAIVILSKNTFKDASAWGNEISGNTFSGEAHLRFQDAKQNSLITLLKYFYQAKMYADGYNATHSAQLQDDDMNTNIPIPPNMDTAKFDSIHQSK